MVLKWLFPVEDEQSSEFPDKRGLALLTAMFVISVVMLFAADFLLNTNVDLKLAVSQRDNLKAEYMAKSGANLGQFLVMADFGVDLFLASPQSPAKTEMQDSPSDIWGMFNGYPLGSEVVEQVKDGFKLNSVLDENVLNQMKELEGEFILNVSDEQSKINVNYCAHSRDCPEVTAALEAVMNCPVEKMYLERNNIRPKEVIYRIKDFIDKNNTSEPLSGLSDETDPYRRKNPQYRPKNAPLDSIDELRLVDGWTRELHAIFSPYMTVFPYQNANIQQGQGAKINYNTAPQELLLCIFSEMNQECRTKATVGLHQSRDTSSGAAGMLAEQPTGPGATPKPGSTSAGKLSEKIKQTFCYTPSTTAGSVDKTQWFDVRSKVFRIEVTGRVGDQEKVLAMVIERRTPDPTKNIMGASKLLYWKMR